MKRRAAGLLVLAVVGAACGAGRRPMPDPLIALATTAVETREVQLHDDLITIRLHLPPTLEPRKATVISSLGDRETLLREGFLVVTYRINWEMLKPPPEPSPRPRENSVGKWVLASPSAAVLGQEYLRTIARTADEMIPRIVDYLVTVPEVDPTRIGFTGNSTNGFVALEALARDRRLAVGVVLSACGDYHRFLQYSSMGMEGRPLELAPAYTRWLRAREVIGHPGRVVHATLLMVNRDHDPIIPIECADETARVLRRAYDRAGAPERFRYSVLAGEQHGLDRRDATETVVWLDRWLHPQPGVNP
jgi:dienelactone hydrolase